MRSMCAKSFVWSAAAGTVLLTTALTIAPAMACSVCFGNPDDSQTKALAAGIWVMIGCITTVLTAFASLFCYWMVRSHRLAMAGDAAIR